MIACYLHMALLIHLLTHSTKVVDVEAMFNAEISRAVEEVMKANPNYPNLNSNPLKP